ncbi:MAG: ATP-binding cassette domain-containing protein [Gammaproteobacteria bacterium]|nr:ATP-binding cassette domain-containing protein [Gammaproteobacteria bacterium]
MMDSKGLEVIQLTKKFADQTVLDDVSFSVKPEQHTVILGPSGCGKSTLLRIITGLLAPDSGEIVITGKVVSSANKILIQPHLRNIGMVFQDLALWPNLTVLKNITLALSSKNISSLVIKEKAWDALEMCGITSLASRKPAEISGGQQQRVALARAIVLKPEYLLLDEPFSGLDLVTKHELMEELAILSEKQNITIVLVTHDPFEATFFAEQALIINNEKIAESGLFTELLAQSQNPIMLKFRTQLQKTKNTVFIKQ